MAITYNWDCKTLRVNTSHTDFSTSPITKSNVAYEVVWTLTATDDDGIVESITRATPLPVNDLSSFQEQEDLTNNIVKAWVFAIIGPDAKTAYEAEVAFILSEKVSPTKILVTLDS
jgi:hypothetical protein|tara:strand:+ start:398 stop:745 length:348 start_codon:yes stop_codon:yes gene_type:complete